MNFPKYAPIFFGILLSCALGVAYYFLIPADWKKISHREPSSAVDSANYEKRRRGRLLQQPSPFQGGKFSMARGLSAQAARAKRLRRGVKLSVLMDRECAEKNSPSRFTKSNARDRDHGMRVEAHTVELSQDSDMESLASEAEQDPCVLGVDFEGTVRKNALYADPMSASQNQLSAIQASASENFFFRSSLAGITKVRIAIVDTGIDYNHPDLASAMWRNSIGQHGYDFTSGDGDPMDDDSDGHGTHVAGLAAAIGGNNEGGSGVMPAGAELMAVKVLDSTGSGTFSDVANGVRWAVENGAQVINLSLVGSGVSTVLEDALVYAVNSGVVVLVSAGNSNLQINDSNRFYSPASYGARYNGVITIGSIDALSHRKSSFSNYGDFVELAAPGSNGILSTTPNASYTYLQGTSMAAPVAAGAAALAVASFRAMGVLYSAADVENALRNSATRNANLNGYVKDRAELNLPRLTQTLTHDYLLTLEGGLGSDVE